MDKVPVLPILRGEKKGEPMGIVLGPAFFQRYTYTQTLYGTKDARQGRVLTILHEIGHLLNKIPDDVGSLGSDPNSPGVKNSITIFEKCKKGILSIPKATDGNYPDDPPPVQPPG